MNWPIYYPERIKIGNLESDRVIVTLWTPVEIVITDISTSGYAAAGLLYSPQGLGFLFRNLLANPKIRYLVLCGADLGQAGERLVRFFDGDVSALPETGLPTAALIKLQSNVKVVNLIGETNSVTVAQRLKSLKQEPPYGEPEVYPLPAVTEKTYPSEAVLFPVRGLTIVETHREILKTILHFGRKTERIGSRPVRAVLNLTAVVENEPKVAPDEYVKSYLSRRINESAYTYGSRLRDYHGLDQLKIMAEKLKSFPGHEGALAVLFDVEKDNRPPANQVVNATGKTGAWNVPCLTLIQAIVLDQKLYLTAYFRANDMLSAWPENARALRFVQQYLAGELKVEIGPLTTISSLAWIDENLIGQADPSSRSASGGRGLSTFESDPRGNFTVEVVETDIVVRHYSPAGELLAEYHRDGHEDNAAGKLMKMINSNVSPSLTAHALYLGGELARASMAVKFGRRYIQDQPF